VVLQAVTFNDNTDLRQVVADQKDSTLTAYFKLNARDVGAHKYLYEEIPKHFRWLKKTREWQWRQRDKGKGPIGRMYNALPCQGERFYLRVLLGQTRAAKCFDHLKTHQVLLG
jgi:hypothetical protein